MGRKLGTDCVLVAGAELTEPYRELLAKGLVANITNEVELIRQAAVSTEGGLDGAAGCSIFVKLAGMEGQPSNTLEGSSFNEETEREGFEPSNEVSPVTRFPVAPVQPLRHLSRLALVRRLA
jgi:hypothetical protein